MVAQNKKRAFSKLNGFDISSSLFQNVDFLRLCFFFQRRFEASFIHTYSWMRFAVKDFLEYASPSLHVRSNIIEFPPVNSQMQWRYRRSVKNSVENHFSAQAMREKKAGNNAFVNYVKSSGIMQACPVAVSSADTRVEEKFSQSFHDVSIFQRQYLTLFKNAIVILTNFRDVRETNGNK